MEPSHGTGTDRTGRTEETDSELLHLFMSRAISSYSMLIYNFLD